MKYIILKAANADAVIFDIKDYESLDNMILADVYLGRMKEVKSKRERIKPETM